MNFVGIVVNLTSFLAWAECLLKFTKVTNVCTVVGNRPSEELADALWDADGTQICFISVDIAS